MEIIFHDKPTCPRCGNPGVDGGPVELDMDNEGRIAWQTVTCNDCGLKYVDVFRYHHSESYEE